MSYLLWNEKYSVHVADLDQQHRKIFELANVLYDAMERSKGKDVVSSVVKEFADYTRYHFAAEERLLEASFYPELSEHREMHESLTHKVQQLKDGLDRGIQPRSIEVMFTLTNWLNIHILQEDRKYIDYIKVIPS